MQVAAQGRIGWAAAGARARPVSQGPDFCVGQERFLPMWMCALESLYYKTCSFGPLVPQSCLNDIVVM